MANQFLVEIHDHISRQLDTGHQALSDCESRGDNEQKIFLEGKIAELKTIRAYLSHQFDLNTQKYY